MEDITVFKERAILRDAYRFFDFNFFISSDSEKVLETFRDIFRRFHLAKPDGIGATYFVLTKKNPTGQSAAVVDDRLYTIEKPDDLIGYAYMKIMDSALAKIEDHYLFHAAALSFKGRGIIFPAVSKSGKTTLTLELVKRGFKFLSDDIAAVSLSDNLLYPFPKSLGLLSPTLELYPEAELDSLKPLPMIGGGEKMLLDIEDMYPESVGDKCPLNYIVFLGGRHDKSLQTPHKKHLYIVVSRINDEIISELKLLEGVKDVSIYSCKKYPILELLLGERPPALSDIEEVCRGYGVVVFDSSDGKDEKVDFNGTPRLDGISRSKAALNLLRQLKRGSIPAIIKDKQNREGVPELLIRIGRLVEKSRCFYLSPGNLKERADKICELVDGSQ